MVVASVTPTASHVSDSVMSSLQSALSAFGRLSVTMATLPRFSVSVMRGFSPPLVAGEAEAAADGAELA